MHKLALMCTLGFLGACIAPAEDRTGGPEEATGVATAASTAFRPMGFARITDAGGVGVAFDSQSTLAMPVTVTHPATGNYQVTFTSLGTASSADGAGGQVQVTTEGTTNVRCRILNWGGTTNLAVSVQCNAPGGPLADSPFAILFFRDVMPAPNGHPTDEAYLYRSLGGAVPTYWDYNSSGTHNTVTPFSTGQYIVTIPGATYVNASMMVTSYGGTGAGAVCSILGWGPSIAYVECRDGTGQLADSAFSFSYALTGPTFEQQGAHAWFDGGAANPTYSAAIGRIMLCSYVNVTGSRSGPVVTMVVSGEIGRLDPGPFLSASFSSNYGIAGYCKVESLTTTGAYPSSTATTTLRCYDATGAVIAAPQLTFTHVTSDAAGPC